MTHRQLLLSQAAADLSSPGADFIDVAAKSGHWVGRRVEGAKSNRIAIGPQVAGTNDEPKGGRRTSHQWANSGTSSGDAQFKRHFDSAAAASIRAVEVAWPGSSRQSFDNLDADTIDPIEEGTRRSLAVRPKSFRFQKWEQSHR